MNPTTVTVEINAELRVSKVTAKACLKLVEMYANQTGQLISGTWQEDGNISYQFSDEVDEDDDQ